MYDSLIYGYGVTLEALIRVGSLHLNCYSSKYLNFNCFLEDFINCKSHSVLNRKFLKLIDIISDETLKTHSEVRSDLRDNFNEITQIGFERWVSRYIFSDNKVSSDVKLLIYILYNFWYSIIDQEVLINVKSKEIIRNIACMVKNNMNPNYKIFTTNFDTMFDEQFITSHIHGKFIIPFEKAKSIILKFLDENSFEYCFMFGTSGYEKLYRLNNINEYENNSYDLDFFFNKDLNLGHVLLIGLSFSQTDIVPLEIRNNDYGEHARFLTESVDGHILLRLCILKENNKLTKITYAYYSQNDRVYFQNLIRGSEIEEIVEYIQSSEILS